MRAPSTKTESHELWQRGRYGNYIRTWPSGYAAEKDGYFGPLTLRYRAHAGGGGPCIYDINAVQVDNHIEEYLSNHSHFERDRFFVNEALHKEYMVLQGELMKNPDWYLFGNTKPMHMRDALKDKDVKTWTGCAVPIILRHCMSPGSYDDLMMVMDEWPDAVIEFSTLSIDFGAVPNRNSVIWELRGY